jgi:Transposase DDE domain
MHGNLHRPAHCLETGQSGLQTPPRIIARCVHPWPFDRVPGATKRRQRITTLEQYNDEIVNIYGQRWNVETDIGNLKGKFRLDHLTSKTPEMIG